MDPADAASSWIVADVSVTAADCSLVAAAAAFRAAARSSPATSLSTRAADRSRAEQLIPVREPAQRGPELLFPGGRAPEQRNHEDGERRPGQHGQYAAENPGQPGLLLSRP